MKEQTATKKVQEQLWRNGYSVKDVSKYTEYNLLVNDQIKVEVKSSSQMQTLPTACWFVEGVKIQLNETNVLAIVIDTPFKDTLIFYTKINEHLFASLKEAKLATKGKRKNTCTIRITPDLLKSVFTESPTKIFKN